ncbi:MAG: SRPBCC family protein [Planctomycetota bacterium]|jgi:uncharacterized protein YndB with AHSA1/START domain
MADLTVASRGDREIVMTRAFDAPRRLVYDAPTRPDHLRRWLGVFGGWTMRVCDLDASAGGAYRFVWRDADGNEMGVRGVCREVAPPERIIWTESFDQPWYPGNALVTHALVEAGGRTTLTTTVGYESEEARDGVLASPMEQGVAESYDNLAELLASIGG